MKKMLLGLILGMVMTVSVVSAEELPMPLSEKWVVTEETMEETVEETIEETTELLMDQIQSVEPRAASIVASETDDALSWSLYSDGYLYIEVTGAVTGGMVQPTNSYWRRYLNDIKTVKLVTADNEVAGVESMYGWFQDCVNLVSVDATEFDAGKTKDLTQLFYGCTNLKEAGVSNWDTSNVTIMNGVFYDCTSLQTVDVSGWDMRNVEEAMAMFRNCESLTSLDLSAWDFDKITNIVGMFYGCVELTELNVSGWEMYGVTSLEGVFGGCVKLTNIDLSSWKMDTLSDLSYAFYYCAEAREIKLPKQAELTIAGGAYAFYYCINLRELDVSECDFSWMQDATGMFCYCRELEYLADMNLSYVAFWVDTFYRCEKLSTNIQLGSNPLEWGDTFAEAATAEGAAICVRIFGPMTEFHLEETLLNTKSENSHIYLQQKPATSFEILGDKRIKLEVGEVYEFEIAVGPEDATGAIGYDVLLGAAVDGSEKDFVILFDPLNPSFKKYKIEGKKPGIVCLRLNYCYDDEWKYLPSDYIIVEVGDASSCTEVSGILLDEAKVTLTSIGETKQLHASVFPEYATERDLVWQSSHPAVMVDQNGVITAVANTEGPVYVAARTPDGRYLENCEVIVNDPNYVKIPVTEISLNTREVTLNHIGDTIQLTATVTPANANEFLTWSSDAPEIATVDENGLVTAVANGTAHISVHADGSGVNTWCNVTVNAFIEGGVTEEQKAQIRSFVERMYTIVLNRAADENGLNDWTAGLVEQRVDGAAVVNGFVNSPEFVARGLSNEDYIKTLYLAVLNREADEFGISEWMRAFAQGATRQDLIDGFVTSAEFESLCDSYGILAVMTQEDMVRNFALRMYTVALNRGADQAGLDYWVSKLMSGAADGAAIADGFINSPEFIARNLSNTDYIKILYRTFLNREASDADVDSWMAAFEQGFGRPEILNAFIATDEFGALCESYGISAILTQRDRVTNFVARMYIVALNRPYDEAGLNDWINGLMNGVIKGAEVAEGFICSAEFEARALEDYDYIRTLYLTFFNREADGGEVYDWYSAMNHYGQSRRDVLRGFVNSSEFGALCNDYGIIRGSL